MVFLFNFILTSFAFFFMPINYCYTLIFSEVCLFFALLPQFYSAASSLEIQCQYKYCNALAMEQILFEVLTISPFSFGEKKVFKLLNPFLR